MGWLRSKKGEASLSVVNNVASPSTGGDNASVIEHMPEVDRGQQLSNIRTSDPYAMKVAHRRLAWMFRLSAITNVVLSFTVVIVISAFASLFPLKEVRLALVKSDAAENRIYRIEPLNQNIAGFNLFLEMQAQRMVRLLLQIDRVTQVERLNEAFKMVDNEFYEKFKHQYHDSDLIKDALEAGITRSIVIESANTIESVGSARKVAVDFNQIDKQQGKVISDKKLRAYLAITTEPQEAVTSDKVYENPLGITLKDMTIRERG